MGLWDRVQDAANQGADAARSGAAQAGDKAKEVVDAAAGYRERFLDGRDNPLAQRVYENTLPYGRILVSNGLGFNQRAYTIPHPVRWGCYLIHIGAADFDNPAVTDPSTFIHELAHVWQGHNNWFPLQYVFQSLWHQCLQGSSAYAVNDADIGVQPWHYFNVEQQANIIHQWFERGESTGDPAFRYIRDNVRGLRRDSGSKTSSTLGKAVKNNRWVRKA